MSSLILRTTTRFLLPLLLLFSIFLLVRGHNAPGGGFSGGLVAAAAFILYATAYDAAEARRILRFSPASLSIAGLAIAAGSGGVAFVFKKPYMTGIWVEISLVGNESIFIGTPLLFDLGVYLAVIGSVMTIFLTLRKE